MKPVSEMTRDEVLEAVAGYREAALRIAALKAELASAKAFMAKLPCPNDGQLFVDMEESCEMCGECWTPEKATKQYHGTALTAWEKKNATAEER